MILMSIEKKVDMLIRVVIALGFIVGAIVIGEKIGLVPLHISGIAQIAFIAFVAVSHEYVDRNW